MFGSLWLWSKLIDVGWDVGIGILGCDGTMYYRFHVSGPFVRMDSVRKEHRWRKALVLERIFSFITSPFVRESNLKRKNNWCLPNSHSWGCYSWRTKILPRLGWFNWTLIILPDGGFKHLFLPPFGEMKHFTLTVTLQPTVFFSFGLKPPSISPSKIYRSIKWYQIFIHQFYSNVVMNTSIFLGGSISDWFQVVKPGSSSKGSGVICRWTSRWPSGWGFPGVVLWLLGDISVIFVCGTKKRNSPQLIQNKTRDINTRWVSR